MIDYFIFFILASLIREFIHTVDYPYSGYPHIRDTYGLCRLFNFHMMMEFFFNYLIGNYIRYLKIHFFSILLLHFKLFKQKYITILKIIPKIQIEI